MSTKAGFTVIEILIAIGIIILLADIGSSAFVSTKKARELGTITDGIAATLDLAKNQALAGKQGSDFGVKFESSSYTYFQGSSFDQAKTNNKTNTMLTGYVISTSLLPSTNDVVVFARLTGRPSAVGDIVISNASDPQRIHTVRIGSLGDITVIK